MTEMLEKILAISNISNSTRLISQYGHGKPKMVFSLNRGEIEGAGSPNLSRCGNLTMSGG
jgi:hypothetical protein